MKPLVEVDRSTVPGGGDIFLYRRGDDFVIHVDGHELMGSRSHASEEQLATLACEGLRDRPARVLVGGLGMGFTVRAALRTLGEQGSLDVAELVPAVVRWNRGPLAKLEGAPLDDPRVRVLEEDVAIVIKRIEAAYDAILLDVDNGPSALTSSLNARLYDAAGLTRAVRALSPCGALGVWSTSDDPKFTARLQKAGFSVQVVRPSARMGGGRRHVVWIARKPGPGAR